MPKICIAPKCKYNVWGKNYCKNHQYLRKDKKKVSLKKSSIRKVSVKGKKLLGERKTLTARDRLFFQEIWEEREHYDYETGEPILGEARTLYFHHLLEKKEYPEFRYCKWNIVLVSWTTHTKCHNNLDTVPKIKSYRNKLIKKYL